jgi:hypothetical protein
VYLRITAELSQYQKYIKPPSLKRWKDYVSWGYWRGSQHLNGRLLCSYNTVHFLSNFGEVNKRIIRKLFPTSKISTVLQELEGVTFAMALDLNMGYYTIRLEPDASRICTIIFSWGKYSYKRLPMGIACSPDIFQSKISELMESLEYVQAYSDDLLCISRSSLEDHLKKLKRYSGAFETLAEKSTLKN